MIKKILKIINANPGWFASFKNDQGEKDFAAIAVWAIVEDNHGYQSISGFIEGEGFFADDVSNFDAWIYDPARPIIPYGR